MTSIQPQSSGLAGWGSGNSRAILASPYHRKLLDNFQQLSRQQSSQSYEALALINAINRLRAVASPLDSMVHPTRRSRRLLVAGGFEIEYELNSYWGDSQTDIEIVDIRIVGDEAKDDRRPALWRAGKFIPDDDRWRMESEPSPRLAPIPGQSGASAESPIRVGINGRCENRSDAASMLGRHIPRGDKAKRAALEQQGFHLLYIPSGGALAEGWSFVSTLGQGGSDDQRQAALVLAGEMLHAHQQGLYVEWTAHSSGSWVLSEAMGHLARRNIDLEQRQKVFLSDHTSSHFTADRRRRALNMNTDDDKWQNAAPALPQLLGGLNLGAASLLTAGNQVLHHTPADERPGKVAGLLVNAISDGRRAWVLGSAATGVMTSGVPWALAVAGVNVAASTIPGTKSEYYQGVSKQVELLVNRIFKRRSGN